MNTGRLVKMKLKPNFLDLDFACSLLTVLQTWEKLTYFLLTVEVAPRKALSSQTLPLWEEHSFHWAAENQVSEFPADLDAL